jgi:hypothetical protein
MIHNRFLPVTVDRPIGHLRVQSQSTPLEAQDDYMITFLAVKFFIDRERIIKLSLAEEIRRGLRIAVAGPRHTFSEHA